jgi:hypothetical protein
MRTKLSLLAALAAAGGTAVITLSSGPASAMVCPSGTQYQYKDVAGRRVGYCVPHLTPQCDPGPCDPTAAPAER